MDNNQKLPRILQSYMNKLWALPALPFVLYLGAVLLLDDKGYPFYPMLIASAGFLWFAWNKDRSLKKGEYIAMDGVFIRVERHPEMTGHFMSGRDDGTCIVILRGTDGLIFRAVSNERQCQWLPLNSTVRVYAKDKNLFGSTTTLNNIYGFDIVT